MCHIYGSRHYDNDVNDQNASCQHYYYAVVTAALHPSLGRSMVKASSSSSEGCSFDQRLGITQISFLRTDEFDEHPLKISNNTKPKPSLVILCLCITFKPIST